MLVSAVGLAEQPHSWCVTGVPLVQGGSSNATTNAVIANVCGSVPRCCSTRWDLSCIQVGARYAKNVLEAGDVCGRFAWAQGPIPGTGQFYPRDFNLFVVAGAATGIRDTDGPVAASNGANFTYFHLNNKLRESVALLTGASAVLTSGTVHGKVMYRTSFLDSQVTYPQDPRPTAPANPFPVDFAATRSKLIAMSQAIKAYDAIPATKLYTTVTFRGSDPELNVFSIPSSMLSETYSYVFDLPVRSNVIVNVTGTSAAIRYAGFSGPGYPTASILWNFPDAFSLTLDSLGFRGSILAPLATANLQNGSVTGTIVVGAASPANVELYASPYHVPSSVGGPALAVDPSWSLTGHVSDEGTAADFQPEAGFLEIGGTEYVAEGQSRVSPTHRVWYSFQPATLQPKTKPLAVFFQGGPGHATSSILFAFNTGPWTLDPAVAGANKIVPNVSANWSQFANLLYIDAPATGFSYPVSVGGTKPSIGNDMDRDAAIFNTVVLRFLKRHPEILNNRVVLVGESYSGARATLMLQHLFNTPSLVSTGPYIDGPLYVEQRDYFSKVLGTTTPSPAQIATKFGHQVLIEAVIAGRAEADWNTIGTPHQFPASACLSPTCSDLIPGVPDGTPTCDDYNCDKPLEWSTSQEDVAAANLTVMSTLSKALGVGANLTNIEWMKATARTAAYGRNDGTIVPAPDMTATFGVLGAEDNYFVAGNQAVLDGYPGAGAWHHDSRALIGAIGFANHLRNGVSTFMTAARFDLVVWGPSIPYAIANLRETAPSLGAILQGPVAYDQAAVTGLPRPGAFWLNYTAPDQRMVTMPHFYQAGHSVTMRAPTELLADVALWYNNSPH
jgi:choice-of-anchor A domain-containing protein